ncbi:phenylalanine--tRNA ligase subunit alpha [Candidatus Microgenomates bacterium]|nr:phenylalanine--tRNA ligase subunit alpha [Candidatus Microgenomates bacterium]
MAIDTKTALAAIKQAATPATLEQLRLRYLGRKGELTTVLRGIGRLPAAQRGAAGRAANAARTQIEAALAARQEELENQAIAADLQTPLDLTAPGKGQQLGHYHPLNQLQRELTQALGQVGFAVAEGPEIETDYYNFAALNIPADHPARDMQDTFYITNGAIPRTHTSSVQIRYMEKHQPPIRIIAPGKVYRNEDEDANHLWAFNQIEGLVVDKGVSLGDLKGTLEYLLRAVFGPQTEIKLVPSFFPYTEPSLEVHARLNKQAAWLEMLGAGMVHPQVLRNVGIDPAVYSGFAFGVGLERLAKVRYGVDDIRYFWRPNLRFLEQF